MNVLQRIEQRLVASGMRFTTRLLGTLVLAFSDYKHRHIGTYAASASFYAIFSLFPFLAFMAYAVAQLLGFNETTQSAPIVMKIMKEYGPAMQGWIEKGLLELIKGHKALNWLNAIALCWSALGLFAAIHTAMTHIPGDHHEEAGSYVAHMLLAMCTLVLFTVLSLTVVFCEVVGRDANIPFWVQSMPFELQDVLYYGARSGILLAAVSVFSVAGLYKLLMPAKLRMRYALLGAILFAALVLSSRSLYWVYLHYVKASHATTYGIFSTLILNMLWIHFITNCLFFSCLFALHLDRNSFAVKHRMGSQQPAPAHGGHGGHEPGFSHGGHSKKTPSGPDGKHAA